MLDCFHTPVWLQFFSIANTQFCKLVRFHQNALHNLQNHTPKLQNNSYILQNEALQPKLHIALSKSNFCMKWHTTSFILPDFCLNNYTLLGIMKSTPIFSMLCHNTKICLRLFTCTEIFADTHMLLKLHFTVIYFS